MNVNATINTMLIVPSPTDKPTIIVSSMEEVAAVDGFGLGVLGGLLGIGVDANCSAVNLTQLIISSYVKSNR